MDEKAAIERISELENRIRSLTQERNNYASCIVNYEAFLKRIPRAFPESRLDLEQEEMTPNAWLEWALKELGYETSD